jgi:hypothetical protein
MPIESQALVEFLLEAKRRTYAGLDDDATIDAPLLAGSKQLEHRSGSFAYRDIYFGLAYFAGQETVSKGERTIWSMSYSGGVRPEISDRNRILSIFGFLRQALLLGDAAMPYRGPTSFTSGEMTYRNRVEGALASFHGHEEIWQNGVTVYELRYNGGVLR